MKGMKGGRHIADSRRHTVILSRRGEEVRSGTKRITPPPFFLPFNPPLVWLNSVRELENDFSIRFPLLGEGEPICDLSSSLFLLLLLLLMFFASLFEKKN